MKKLSKKDQNKAPFCGKCLERLTVVYRNGKAVSLGCVCGRKEKIGK